MTGDLIWTVFDTGQTAQLLCHSLQKACGRFEQPPEKSSNAESKTALVWLIVFAFWQNSLVQVKPYMGTITVTPRSEISPHSSLHSVDVPTSALNFCSHYSAPEESLGHIALE